MSACPDCGAEVRWATAAHTGRRIAVDAEPSPHGEYGLELVLGANGMHLAARPLGAIARMDERIEGRAAHQRTCVGVRERVA